MTEFQLAATGGTFDIIHKGHRQLLSKAFKASFHVIIGLTSDEMARRRGKKTLNSYQRRLDALMRLIQEEFDTRQFQISKLENDFGPAMFEKDVQALIVSEETQDSGQALNEMRAGKNLPPVMIISIPMTLAEDGTRISTTRIKRHEIDTEGNLLLADK